VTLVRSREGNKCCLLSKLLLDGGKICYTERQMLIFVFGIGEIDA